MNKLFNVLGGKFKFSAQDSDLEHLCWRCKNSPVSDLKPPLTKGRKKKQKSTTQKMSNLCIELIKYNCIAVNFSISLVFMGFTSII